MSSHTDLIPEDINEAASHWLSRRDRGLTATEQDAYLEWLYRSPLHGRAIVQFELSPCVKGCNNFGQLARTNRFDQVGSCAHNRFSIRGSPRFF